jgi:4-hydroxy-2-oxoheptanedioate aldolase
MMDLSKPRRGLFVKLPAPAVIDMAGAAGLDFVVVDLEHSQLSEADAIVLVRHADLAGIPAIVRVPLLDRGQANRLLEAGAEGIQLSTVTSVEQVRDLSAALRYAPQGGRSISNTHRAAAYGALELVEYVRSAAADPPLVVIQVETAVTEDPLEEIVAAGADVVFVGTMDLEVSVQFDAAASKARIDEICAAAASSGASLGGVQLGRGATYEVVGSDVGLLAGALRRAAAGEGKA